MSSPAGDTPPPTGSALARWAPWWAWGLFIAGLALYPKLPPLMPPIWQADKLAHALFWAPFGPLGLRALGADRRGATWLIGTAHGAAIEILQGLVPGRFPQALDVVADGLGVALGIAAFVWWSRRRERAAA